jgi:hypothetical protein
MHRRKNLTEDETRINSGNPDAVAHCMEA